MFYFITFLGRFGYSQYIGAELISVENKMATISIELQPHHFQQHHFVHGGVISYLADNTITFAGGLALQGNEPPQYCRRLNNLREYDNENTTLYTRNQRPCRSHAH